MVEPDRSQMTIWSMRLACWITKATDAHSEHVTLIAFSLLHTVAPTGLNVTLYLHCPTCYQDRHSRFLVSVGRSAYLPHRAPLKTATLHGIAVRPIDYAACHCSLLSAINDHFVRLQKLT